MEGVPAEIARPWHTVPADEAATQLGTGPDGLDPDEAARRLERYGPNEIEAERETPWWRILLHQFQDPLIYILIAATGVTLALRDYTDAGVIGAVVVLNALIGFIQELRAQQAIQGLARLSAPKAEVVRAGAAREIDSRELVPGDVVLLTSGARVPADLRLVSTRNLAIDESMLTGESVPAGKQTEPLDREILVAADQTNLAFAGTTVTRGRARGITVRTGAATELGRIASRVREIGESATPLQEKIERLGRWVGVVVLGASAVTLVAGLLLGLGAGEIFLTVVALAVATVPEGLPVVLTVTLAVGVRRMASRNAIIRSLPAVETLGSTTVIATDKTGTLTRNEMTVRAIWAGGRRFELTGAGYDREGEIRLDGEPVRFGDGAALFRAVLAGTLANEADPGAADEGRPQGDPTEIALHVAALKAGRRARDLRAERPEVDVLPFEPERRYMATLNEEPDGGRSVYMKGAPEVVVARCERQLSADGTAPLDVDAIRAAAEELGNAGLRVLATAYRPTDADLIEEDALRGGFVFAGLHGMEDPVRPEAVDAAAAARAAGIRVIMLTGDHVGTARAIGRAVGLGGEAVEGERIEVLSDADLDRVLDDVDVFARVAPDHKFRITQRLKEKGEIVAVTGDGVNDAPALRVAHLGVAMGRTGTDAAREASDVVLTDDNFATITAAVEEGRIVFSNIRKVTFFLLSTGVAMPITILVALFAGMPLPYLPAQILWINLVTNGLQDVALAFEPGEPGVLDRPPRSPGEGIVNWAVLERLAIVGLVLATGTLAMFWWALEASGDVDYARTVAMTQMVIFQFFHVLNSRSLDRSILRIPLFSNRFLFASMVAAIIAQLLVIYVPVLQTLFRTAPLASSDWTLILAVGTAVVIGGEVDKAWRRRRARKLG